MTEPTIYIDYGRPESSIGQALDDLTDEWVHGGQTCPQTTLDLIAALRWAMDEIEHLTMAVTGWRDAYYVQEERHKAKIERLQAQLKSEAHGHECQAKEVSRLKRELQAKLKHPSG